MYTFRSALCLLLFVSFSVNAVAENVERPSGTLTFGRVEVKDGQFVLTQFQPIQQTYTVQVPVTVSDKNGKIRTETIMETRESFVMAPKQLSVTDQTISFSKVSGDRITDLEEVRKMLQKESQPAIITWLPDPVDAYYQKVLNPKLLVVHYGRGANNVDAYLSRGHDFYSNKEYAKAIAEYTLAMKIDPQNPVPWNLLACMFASCPDEMLRDGKAAVTAAQKANEVIKDNGGAFAGYTRQILAAAYATAGDFGQATATMDDAIKLLGPEGKFFEDEFRRSQALFKSNQILIGDPSGMVRVVMNSIGTNVFQAELVSLKGDKVTLKKMDGKTVDIPLSKLSEGDRQWAFETDIVRVLVGGYEAERASNDWHYVEITEDHGHLIWKNAANRSWSLVFKGKELWSGPDCPYGERKWEIKRNDAGEVTSLEQGKVVLLRKPSAAKIVREKTAK